MNFIHSFNNKTILIPLLQRDYVQGGREDVISPFIDSLLEKDTDLNYIYGYEEDGCFVPIDGQQRPPHCGFSTFICIQGNIKWMLSKSA